MIDQEHQIPYLLSRLQEEVGLEKTATLVDAIIGAPVGAIAARISATEEKKDEATRRGLIVGALLGWLAGQKSIEDAQRGEKTPGLRHPLVAAAAGGAGVGLYSRAESPIRAALQKIPTSK